MAGIKPAIYPARAWAITAAAAAGIASPGYIHHGTAALAPFIIADFSMSKTTYGLLLAVFSAVGALASPALGLGADRFGGRRMLLWAFVAAIAASVLIALAPVLPLIVLGMAIGGLTAAAANPATNTLVAVDIPPSRVAWVVGVKQAGGPAGIFLAGIVLPAIAVLSGWRIAYLTGAVIPLVGLGLMIVSRAQRHRTGTAVSVMRWQSALTRPIQVLTLNATAVGFGVGATLGFVAVYAVEELGMSQTAAGAQIAIIGLLGFLSRLAWGGIAHRVDATWMLLLAMSGLSVIGGVLMWMAADGGIGLLIAGSVVLGVSALAWNTVGMLAVVREASIERSGTASGIVVLGFLAGVSTGPWVFGALVDSTGDYAAAWLAVIFAFVVSGLVVLFGRHR